MNYSILRAWFRRMINWTYKNSQHPEAITYAEQRHRIQVLDEAYSPVSHVVLQQSNRVKISYHQDNGPTVRISTHEIVDVVNDAFNVGEQGMPSSIETNNTAQQDSTPKEDKSKNSKNIVDCLIFLL